MLTRPERLWDQYKGKAFAEAVRGSGWWPLQPHPCGLEPPWDAFDRQTLSIWDCFVNEWDAPYSGGGLLSQLISQPRTIPDIDRKLILPPVNAFDSVDLVPIVIEQFPDDSSSIPKADQLLRSLPRLRRPASFEILGRGPVPKFDRDKAKEVLLANANGNGERRNLDEAICGWRKPETTAQFVVHPEDVPRLERLLSAHYPNSAVTAIRDSDCWSDCDAGSGVRSGEGYAATLALAHPYCLALRTFGHLDPDPLGVAIAAMEDLGKYEWAAIQILFERAEAPWADTLEEAVRNPYREEFFFSDITPRELAQKFCGPLFAVAIRICASRKDVFKQLEGWAEQFTSENQRLVFNHSEWDAEGHMPEYEYSELGLSIMDRTSFRPGMLLNSNELASLVHLPSQAVVSERLRATRRRTRPATETSDEGGSVLLGQNVHRGKTRTARISPKLRERHCYVAGGSGTGKSTLLLNMILQDIAAGQGVGVLDPHGDLVQDVLVRLPEDRIEDVILFDPSDDEFPIALNILESRDPTERERIVAETLMALERYFPSSWGPRLERILTFTLYTALDAIPNATLSDVERMLIDSDFRRHVIDRTQTERYVQFWNNEFAFMPKNAADPVLNKLSVFLLNPTVRNIVCQRRSAVDFDEVLNRRKIFLANLSTGILSEKIAGILGSFLVTKIVNAAFRRARIPHDRRRPWYLYVDEFQAFMNLSVGFDRILAEARKYRLVLTMANQYVGQLSQEVKQAVFGNAGTLLTFRLGVQDAATIAREMGVFTEDEILSLGVGEAIARAGGSETAFNLTTFPKPEPAETNPTAAVVSQTHEKYAVPRAAVEAQFAVEKTERSQDSDKDDSRKRRSPNSRERRARKKPPPSAPRDPHEDDLVS